MIQRVKVDAWKKGLVIKNNNLIDVLSEGTYWLSASVAVINYDMAKPFVAPINLNILMKNQKFADAVKIVNVADNEIALRYEGDTFVEVLTQGKYLYWEGLVEHKIIAIDLSVVDIDVGIDKAILTRKELAPYIRTFVIEPNEKAIVYIDGKFNKIVEAGSYSYWKNNTNIAITKVETRTMQMEVAGQEILTKDKAVIRLNFYLQYNVVDAVKAILNNKEYEKQLYVLIQLALREFVGSMTLDELFELKENVSDYRLVLFSRKVSYLSVLIKGCGIRDIILPGDMKEIMNQVLIAEKKAQANTIMRREETASTRSLLNTAKLMEDNAMLFKLKEMEYVEKIAEKINTISLSGGSQIVDQLKQIFVSNK